MKYNKCRRCHRLIQYKFCSDDTLSFSVLTLEAMICCLFIDFVQSWTNLPQNSVGDRRPTLLLQYSRTMSFHSEIW